MPAFLDLLFSCTRTKQGVKSQLGGFHALTRFGGGAGEAGPMLPALARSGVDLQLCFSLGLAEPIKDHWTWSIREIAVYHQFDVRTGQASWIVLKGGQLLQTSVLNSGLLPKLAGCAAVGRALALAIELLLLPCEMCVENWQWYLDFLERHIHAITDAHLSGVPQMLRIASDSIQLAAADAGRPARSLPASRRTARPPSDGEDLQEAQLAGQRLNQMLLVLRSNIAVLAQLGDFYGSLFDGDDAGTHLADVRRDCLPYIALLGKRVSGLAAGLLSLEPRLVELISMLAERKTLVWKLSPTPLLLSLLLSAPT